MLAYKKDHQCEIIWKGCSKGCSALFISLHAVMLDGGKDLYATIPK